MNKFSIILSALALGMAATTQAQDLNQQVDVQHTSSARHHDATRQNSTPRLVLPAITAKPLSFSERTISVGIPNTITQLDPTAYADTLAVSPYNGYASIGYLPVYNLAASAGYRVLNTDRHRLSLWGQFDGNSYKDSRAVTIIDDKESKQTIFRNTLTLGADYHYMVGKRSELATGLDYTYSRFNAPGRFEDGAAFADPAQRLYNQNVNRLRASAQWISSYGGLRYTAGMTYRHFGYQKGYSSMLLMPDVTDPEAPIYDPAAERPVRENQFLFNGAAALALSSSSAVYLGLDVDVINNTRSSRLDLPDNGNFNYLLLTDDTPYNHAVLTLNPRYRLKNNNLTMTLGARLQFTFHSGRFIHIAPDVNISWTPASIFTIWGRASGGEHQNTLADLFDVNYMTMPMVAYRNSHIPITVDAGVVIGPRKGAYAELFGGYAIANDWLMPVGYPQMLFGPTMFRAVDIKGWHAGVTLGYRYRNLIDGKVTFEAAPQSYDRGYYLWRDRAKYVVKAQVTARPIDRLEVGVNYELRACRAMIDRATLLLPESETRIISRTNLGNISNLGLNASYRITPALTAFLNLENMLNRHPLNVALVEEQGLRGLVGIAYKF